MTARYASGKNAWGLCDRCGRRFKLNLLKKQIVRGKTTSLKVCNACNDKDHPQLFLGDQPIDDPQALRDPRSDAIERDASRELIGTPWTPPIIP